MIVFYIVGVLALVVGGGYAIAYGLTFVAMLAEYFVLRVCGCNNASMRQIWHSIRTCPASGSTAPVGIVGVMVVLAIAPLVVGPVVAICGIVCMVVMAGKKVAWNRAGNRSHEGQVPWCPYIFTDEGQQGGVGEVYTVREWRFGTDFVLKRLRNIYVQDTGFHSAFMQEYAILEKLTQKHYRWAPKLVDASAAICGKRDFLSPAEESWYVMTKVRGITLDCVITDMASHSRLYRFPLRLRIVRELAVAIKTLHEYGIAHRDITPDNIFVTGLHSKKPNIMLIDFGSGSLSEFDDPLKDKLILKVAYAPPEQFRSLGCAGSGADIYSFGIICYEVLSGKRVFPETGKAYTEADHVNLDRTHAARVLMKESGVHERVADYVCNRLMAEDVQKRGSIDDFLELVEKYCFSPRDKG